MSWINIIGYTGTALIALSITMNNIWRLRWINLFGAATFATYGFLVSAYPVLALNSFITLVDIYYLAQMSRRKDYFTLAEVPEGSYLFLNKFLEFYQADIARFFPEFTRDRIRSSQCVFILRNLVPVGLFIYEAQPGGVAEIHLDYVRPEYRDLKNARFLYAAQAESLQARGIHTFIARSRVKAHRDYLQKMGFETDPEDRTFFYKTLDGQRVSSNGISMPVEGHGK